MDDVVASIVHATGAILCRIWIVGPGDLCSRCLMAPECPDRARCLHLLRSDGLSRRLDGSFRRFPLGAREVGRVAVSLEPHVMNGGLEASGLADPTWLSLHRIASFGAWPLAVRGRCIGVAALFSPRAITQAEVRAVAAIIRLAANALGDGDAPDGIRGGRAQGETRSAGTPGGPTPALIAVAGGFAVPSSEPATPPHSMADVQRAAILAALARTGGKVSGPGGAAEVLGMKSTTLESRMRKLGVRKPPGLRLR